jgi:hypothetical protein
MPYINTKYVGNCTAKNCIKTTRSIKIGERIFYADHTKKSMHEACASIQFAGSTNPMHADTGEANHPQVANEPVRMASEANPMPPMPSVISDAEKSAIQDCDEQKNRALEHSKDANMLRIEKNKRGV